MPVVEELIVVGKYDTEICKFSFREEGLVTMEI